jgi:hypothetical protein
MDSAHRSFRDVEPHSGHQVRSLSYSINGDQFLVTTGNAKAKIYSRDGHEMYVLVFLFFGIPLWTSFSSSRCTHLTGSLLFATRLFWYQLLQCGVCEGRHVPAGHGQHERPRRCADTGYEERTCQLVK